MRSLGYTHRPLRPSGKQGVRNRGIKCPARVVIEMPVLLIHHDPDIRGVDMHEFRPERFTEGGIQRFVAFPFPSVGGHGHATARI
jgi:hypothetical protein